MKFYDSSSLEEIRVDLVSLWLVSSIYGWSLFLTENWLGLFLLTVENRFGLSLLAVPPVRKSDLVSFAYGSPIASKKRTVSKKNSNVSTKDASKNKLQIS